MTPRQGVNWTVVTPELLRPAPVKKAHREAVRLRELVQTEQEALIAATSALETAEAADVHALAQSFRTGTKATPSTAQVEQARAAVREHERRVEGAREALTAAEADLGVELQRQRES